MNFTPTSPSRSIADRYSLSPLSAATQRLLASPVKPPRSIPKSPYKVLDAPELQDDFYLNLVDWSSSNVLGVGLGSCVYLWSAQTGKVTKLCDLGVNDSVTSVNWNPKGSHLAIGTNSGPVQLWDVLKNKKVRNLVGHDHRVGTLAWNDYVLSSGSRDRTIITRDMRAPNDTSIFRHTKHKQEVCGLKWSPNNMQLASGGNDNRLMVWDRAASNEPLYTFRDHEAAIKAIAWSPHQSGLLASGGGSADKKIRFWNTQTGSTLSCIDTGSQVCNVAWSSNLNEIVSTHGYSQNEVVVWKELSPALTKQAVLTGHSMRVLYLAVSPDSENIVTGAGDETLRFWNVFAKRNRRREDDSSSGMGDFDGITGDRGGRLSLNM
ncbi:putative subunit of the anaphase promoting complex [Zopfochytrium polystomum]|nr:putative subunit of the anaphase promoting complex [Zopfochytrium polystomum]